jgi:hypothetical protein
MGNSALIVSQLGGLTPGLRTLISAQGYDPVETVVTDQPEDGRYYLSPSTIDRVADRIAGFDGTYVVVDGDLHPGQAVDLRERFPAATVRDRSTAFWELLSASNPVAATRLALRQCRIDRRAVAQADRDAAATGPSGLSSRLAECERNQDELQDRLKSRQQAASRRVANEYDGVDGRVVLLSRPGVATTDCWAALTGSVGQRDTATIAGGPTWPITATAAVGAHTVAVTDTPGIPSDDGLLPWVEAVVPGVRTAIQQADLLVGIGSQSDSLVESVAERADTVFQQLPEPDPDLVRTAIDGTLETVAYHLRLPYVNAAHALIADLYDDALVHVVAYDDCIQIHVALSIATIDDVTRRVDTLEGTSQPVDSE